MAVTTKSTLGLALLAAQAEMPALQKSGINPHFKNKYVPLEQLIPAILPILNKHGLVLLQMPSNIEGEPALTTAIYHAESGESVTSTMPLMLAKDDPQGQGSGITYARRYAAMGFLALVGDLDDDAEGAKKRTTTPSTRRVTTTQSIPGGHKEIEEVTVI